MGAGRTSPPVGLPRDGPRPPALARVGPGPARAAAGVTAGRATVRDPPRESLRDPSRRRAASTRDLTASGTLAVDGPRPRLHLSRILSEMA